MDKKVDHNTIIKKIAKERLKPNDIFQKGQSRTFLCDKGWYTIVIEFQPFTRAKGTFLNIGVDFNFYPRDYFAFSYHTGQTKFKEFLNEEQFIQVVNGLCELIINRVQELNLKFKDIETALKTYEKGTKAEDRSWRLYDLAVLNALSLNFELAQKQFRQLAAEKCTVDFEIERQKLILEILNWIQDRPAFINNFEGLIQETRKLKKLPDMSLDNFTAPVNMPDSTSHKTWLTRLFQIFGS